MTEPVPSYNDLLKENRELKQTLSAIDSFRQTYENAWNSLIFGLVRINSDGHILDINPYGSKLIGKSYIELINTSFQSYFQENVTGYITETHKGKSLSKSIKLHLQSNNEGVFMGTFEFSIFPDGQPSVLVVLQDISESEKNTRILLEKEHFLNQAQKIANFGHYVLDIPSGSWNGSPELLRIMGVSKSIKTDVPLWLALIHPDDRDMMSDYFLNKIVKGKESFNKEYRILRPSDGETIWVRGKGELQLNSKGEPIKMIGTIQDISDQKATEHALNISKALYHDLVETSQDLVWQCDIKGNYIFVNHAWENTLGYTQEEMLGHHFTEFLGMAQIEKDLGIFSELMHKGVITGHESAHYHKNGDAVILSLNIKPVVDANGKIIGVRGTARNITETKIAEQLIREKTEELDRYFNTALDLLCMTDSEGRFVRVNPEWEKVLGYETSELLSQKFLDFVHPDDISITLSTVEHLQKGEEVLNFINRYRCKNGDYKFIEWRSAMIGSIIYAAARDVTLRIELEEILKQSNQELRESNAQKDKFLYIIAHDLRNPLHNILGIADLLNSRFNENSPEENFKLIQLLGDSTHSMYELIENLLNWALSQTGKLVFKGTSIKLKSLVNKAIQQVLPMATTKNIQLVNYTPDNILVWADETMMGTVLRNLISNAVKFSFPENSVEIRCEIKIDKAVLEVRDYGIGIRPQVVEGLFSLENVYLKKGTSGEKGTGFGLPLCRELMKMQNGSIRAESEPGKGSSFFTELPLANS